MTRTLRATKPHFSAVSGRILSAFLVLRGSILDHDAPVGRDAAVPAAQDRIQVQLTDLRRGGEEVADRADQVGERGEVGGFAATGAAEHGEAP
ncbi:hypothetical protein TH66_05755 [Carbonactinospora thermoautotrophica]|uniref:Uncharacterized protein n=1 Tax=Carbonactinospora thermoautotrophica TaxID=1469144 RepID=A0A132N3K7_9ACTN|nr:hypothetical protein TH66_05755 [Carbonactinospora thermoautotrophica]